MFCACEKSPKSLRPVTVAEFEKFVNETNYETDAEKYGWSIVQINVHDFITVDGATWRLPDGKNAPQSKNLPVTQVSYNDAMAYCEWANTKLPSYDEYWELIKNDKRIVVSENTLPISKVDEVNVLGNVWELTTLDESIKNKPENVRLAGGSLLCSVNSCNGTVKERSLYVDRATGNIHIGFAVVE